MIAWKSLIIACSMALAASSPSAQPAATAKLDSGVMQDVGAGDVVAFKRIPFAASTAGAAK